MTEHYFDDRLAGVHYYKFGNGPGKLFCFHGYGMHGKQFTVLEADLGERYTFYGFDLFFHKGTILHDERLENIQRGITKLEFSELIQAFCALEDIRHFSVIAYSMGTHYANALLEIMPKQLDEYILLAPSCLKPGTLISFLSSVKLGNKIFEKLMLSDKGLLRLLKLIKRLGIIDEKNFTILLQETATPQLRFSFYASASYLHQLKTDEEKMVKVLNEENIKSYFIFGKRDTAYPASISDPIMPRLKKTQRFILDEDHDLVNGKLGEALTRILK